MKIMNTAMMPQEGIFELIEIDKMNFILTVKEEFENCTLDSYIGYPETIKILKKMTGCDIPLNRSKTILEDKDTILILRLNYRIQDPKTKSSHVPNEDDYLFFICNYRKFTDEYVVEK